MVANLRLQTARIHRRLTRARVAIAWKDNTTARTASRARSFTLSSSCLWCNGRWGRTRLNNFHQINITTEFKLFSITSPFVAFHAGGAQPIRQSVLSRPRPRVRPLRQSSVGRQGGRSSRAVSRTDKRSGQKSSAECDRPLLSSLPNV